MKNLLNHAKMKQKFCSNNETLFAIIYNDFHFPSFIVFEYIRLERRKEKCCKVKADLIILRTKLSKIINFLD